MTSNLEKEKIFKNSDNKNSWKWHRLTNLGDDAQFPSQPNVSDPDLHGRHMSISRFLGKTSRSRLNAPAVTVRIEDYPYTCLKPGGAKAFLACKNHTVNWFGWRSKWTLGSWTAELWTDQILLYNHWPLHGKNDYFENVWNSCVLYGSQVISVVW